MKCPACSHDVEPLVEFTTGGLHQKCPRVECNVSLGGVQVTASSEAPIAIAAPRGLTAPYKRTRPAPAQSFDVVKAAKARLREVERQLRDMRKLETEREQLKRLLTAAERPLAEVKRLRSSS